MAENFPIPRAQWHFVHKRVRSPLYTSLFWEGLHFTENKNIPFDYGVRHVLYLDTQIAMDQESWDRIYKEVKSFTSKNSNALQKLLHDNYEVNVRVEEFAKSCRNRNFDKQNLIDLWKQYRSLLHEFGSYALLPLYLETDLEKELRQAINEKYPSEAEDIYRILTTPVKAGSAQLEEIAMLELAVCQQEGALTDGKVIEYLEEFSWIINNSFVGKFFTVQDVHERLKLILEAGDPKKRLEDYKADIKKQEEYFAEAAAGFKTDERISDIIALLQESIYFRSWRTERFYRNAYFLQDLFATTARQLGLSNDNDIFYLSVGEIVSALEDPKIIANVPLAERRQGYFCIATAGKALIYSGDILQKAKREIRLEDISGFHGELKGQSAFKGKVQGKVSLVITKEDLALVQEGSILVSPSTTVDYVPALKKVIGIVTEEGGVLSHASVISRELRIPCVIGTKVATQVFKNDDMIEVDANTGIIKKV